MTRAQRIVVSFGAGLMGLMLLVPPFHEVSAMGRVGDSLGYHLIGMAPEDGFINITALLIQLAAVVVGLAGVWWACGATECHLDPPGNSPESENEGK